MKVFVGQSYRNLSIAAAGCLATISWQTCGGENQVGVYSNAVKGEAIRSVESSDFAISGLSFCSLFGWSFTNNANNDKSIDATH